MAKTFNVPSTIIQRSESKIRAEGLHAATRYTLLLCRCVGLFPVAGLKSANLKNVRFVWRSPYTVLTLSSIFGQSVIVIYILRYIIAFNKTDMRNMHKLFMHVSGLISTLVVVRLACRWPGLLRTTRKMEDELPMFRFKKVVWTCNTITALVFLCELITQVLSVMFYTRISADCYETERVVEAYFKYTGAWIFKTSEFSIWKAIFFQVMNLQTAFIINFTDCMIMVLSLHLSAYFHDFNENLDLYKNKHPSTWAALRRRYTRLAGLVRAADAELGPLVLISFTSNLVYVCVQLFKVIRRDKAHNVTDCDMQKIQLTLESIERALYFGFSSVFITARALSVGLLASRLQSASLAPSFALCEAPDNIYTVEAQRFLDQIKMSKVSLTGLGFFHITRRTVLSMLASIVTYELMLLQFTGK